MRSTVLLAAPLLLFAASGCDSGADLTFEDTFEARVDGERLRGPALLESGAGTVSEATLTLRSDGRTVYVEDDALLQAPPGEPFVPLRAGYRVAGGLGPYGYERGTVEITNGAGGVVTGTFDLVLRTSDGLFFQNEVRARGSFRVRRPAPTTGLRDGGRR